jgi:prolipoprotein diacylglyceryl transferase
MTGALAFIPPPPTNGFQVGPLFFHIYGLVIAIGILAAVGLARRRWAATGRDPAELEQPMFWGVVAGFIGGRLGYVSTHLASFEGRPWAVLAIWEGGLALYGGLTLGIATGLFVARRRGLPVLRAIDAVIPGIPLAQAFGRWGNYFNQELFGTPTTVPWALEVEEPHRGRYRDFETFHPTFLYESLYNLGVVALLLWIGRRWRLRPGSLALCYGVLYGTGRFLLELLRTDTVWRLFGLSRNAYVSIAVVTLCAVALVLRERNRPAAEAEAAAAEAEAATADRDADAGAGADADAGANPDGEGGDDADDADDADGLPVAAEPGPGSGEAPEQDTPAGPERGGS